MVVEGVEDTCFSVGVAACVCCEDSGGVVVEGGCEGAGEGADVAGGGEGVGFTGMMVTGVEGWFLLESH